MWHLRTDYSLMISVQLWSSHFIWWVLLLTLIGKSSLGRLLINLLVDVTLGCGIKWAVEITILVLLLNLVCLVEWKRGIECLLSGLSVAPIGLDCLITSKLGQHWASNWVDLLHVSWVHQFVWSNWLFPVVFVLHQLLHVLHVLQVLHVRLLRLLTYLRIVFDVSWLVWKTRKHVLRRVTSKITSGVMGCLICLLIWGSSCVLSRILVVNSDDTSAWGRQDDSPLARWLILVKRCLWVFCHRTILLGKILSVRLYGFVDSFAISQSQLVHHIGFDASVLDVLLTRTVVLVIVTEQNISLRLCLLARDSHLSVVQWKTSFSTCGAFTGDLFHVRNSTLVA